MILQNISSPHDQNVTLVALFSTHQARTRPYSGFRARGGTLPDGAGYVSPIALSDVGRHHCLCVCSRGNTYPPHRSAAPGRPVGLVRHFSPLCRRHGGSHLAGDKTAAHGEDNRHQGIRLYGSGVARCPWAGVAVFGAAGIIDCRYRRATIECFIRPGRMRTTDASPGLTKSD